jgi:hypothetical protein
MQPSRNNTSGYPKKFPIRVVSGGRRDSECPDQACRLYGGSKGSGKHAACSKGALWWADMVSVGELDLAIATSLAVRHERRRT